MSESKTSNANTRKELPPISQWERILTYTLLYMALGLFLVGTFWEPIGWGRLGLIADFLPVIAFAVIVIIQIELVARIPAKQ